MVSLRMLTCLIRPCQPIGCLSTSRYDALSSSHFILYSPSFCNQRCARTVTHAQGLTSVSVLVPCARRSFALNLQALASCGSTNAPGRLTVTISVHIKTLASSRVQAWPFDDKSCSSNIFVRFLICLSEVSLMLLNLSIPPISKNNPPSCSFMFWKPPFSC